jgi:hypothetical protein
MNYNISKYSLKKAKELNVIIRASTKKDKKIDIFDKDNKYIVSIGNINYMDFPAYIKKNGLVYAMERRRLYHLRHKDNNGIAGKYAKEILW